MDKDKNLPVKTEEDAELEAAASVEGDNGVIKFTRTYDFEGEKVNQVNLSGLDDLTASDMAKATKIVCNNGVMTTAVETTMPYALAMASMATKYPLEFFNKLKPRDAIKIRTKVQAFLFGGE